MAIVFIDVDQEKIDKGQSKGNRSRIGTCPVALGAQPVIPTFSHVARTELVLIDRTGIVRRIELPPVAKEFIDKADTQANVALGRLKPDKNDIAQEKLKPIRFPVQIPDEYL